MGKVKTMYRKSIKQIDLSRLKFGFIILCKLQTYILVFSNVNNVQTVL